nr:hypothetical protein [Brucella anthropi]
MGIAADKNFGHAILVSSILKGINMSVKQEYFDDIVATFGQFYRENGGNWGAFSKLFAEKKFDDKTVSNLMKLGRDEGNANLVGLASIITKLSKAQKEQLEAKALEYVKATAKA